MKILGMDHIALPVGDLDAAEDFYTRIMGGEVVRRIGNTESDKNSGRAPQVIIKVADSVTFNLNADSPDVPKGHFPHWAFMGRFEDLDEWIETFKKEGIKHYGPYGHGGVGRIFRLELLIEPALFSRGQVDVHDPVFKAVPAQRDRVFPGRDFEAGDRRRADGFAVERHLSCGKRGYSQPGRLRLRRLSLRRVGLSFGCAGREDCQGQQEGRRPP